MKYILRIKAISDCMGIRRASLCYKEYQNEIIDVSLLEHPLNVIKQIEVEDDIVSINNQKQQIKVGDELLFAFAHKVSGASDTFERVNVKIMLMPLANQAIDYYKKAIEDKCIFDYWDGEFEYLIGLIYELELNDLENANVYYDLARKKRFKFTLLK